MKKTQIFISSILIISLITLSITLSYNYFSLRNNNKVSDYLILDEMISYSNNYFDTLSKIINLDLTKTFNENTIDVTLDSHLITDYDAQDFLTQFNNLMKRKKRGFNIEYEFSDLNTAVISNLVIRKIAPYDTWISINYVLDEIKYENITNINSFIFNFDFVGTITTFSQNCLGTIPVTIIGPSGFIQNFNVGQDCSASMRFVAAAGNDDFDITFDYTNDELIIDYGIINQIDDIEMKLVTNFDYDDLFKISSPYVNTFINLSKAGFNLNKNFE
jgi:hypothetical protein